MPTEIHQILGADSEKKDVVVTEQFLVAASYPKSVGKFPSAYGNVALIDCHYVFDYLFDYAKNDYAKTIDDPVEKQAFLAYVNAL